MVGSESQDSSSVRTRREAFLYVVVMRYNLIDTNLTPRFAASGAALGIPAVNAQVQAHATLIANFAKSLMPFDQIGVGDRNNVQRQVLAVAHGLAHVSMVHLHNIAALAPIPQEGLIAIRQHASEISIILDATVGEHAATRGEIQQIYDPVLSVSMISLSH